MTKVTLVARYATFVDEDLPAKSYYGKTGYCDVNGTAGKRKRAVIWFSSPFGPEGGNVLRATLTVKTRKITGTGTHTLEAGLAGKWGLHFKQLTWITKPVVAGATTVVSKSGTQPLNTPWSFDLTKQLQAVADGQGMYGLVVSSTVAENIALQGQMGGDLAPQLTVEWTLAPKAPSGLAPSGGRSVGEARPTLRWGFYDHAGEDQLKAVQVQLSSTTAFTAPLWDSGQVLTSWCTMDLSLAQYTAAGTSSTAPALTAGQTVWWRVRNQDTAGLWSAWSAPQSFRYDPRPTVTLQNPGPATPYLVDPTPPIDWTTTGNPTHWRVEIYVLDKHGKWGLQDTSGLRRGSETVWTPTKPLRYRNALYRINVYVHDDLDREATPGCVDYGRDDEEVRFIPDGDTTSAYKLTAKTMNATPAVDVTWQQTQQPDKWHVYRDGKLLASYSGTALLRGAAPNYGIIDRWVPAGEHTWQVYAIANDTSWPSATVTATVSHMGTWLVNEDTQQAVCLVGDLDHDMTMPEDVTVHVPLGARHGIAITGGRRGYEGTAQGVIIDTPACRGSAVQNPQVWHDNLIDFKTDTGQEYLLLIEDLGIPVMISNVDVSGIPTMAGKAWLASFAWRQTGAWTF